MRIPFIKYSKIWYTLSAATVVASIIILAMWGLKYGIDFTGGSLVELTFEKNRPSVEQMQKTFENDGLKDTVIQKSGDSQLIIRTNFLSEDKHQELIKKIDGEYSASGNIREDSFETIGSSVSQQLRQRAIWAIVFVNLGIIIYVAYAFRKVSRQVESWKYGALAIVALVHDILVVLAAFAILGHFIGTEIGVDFVVALLTVLGYSVTDTIVVYDRIRENLLLHRMDDFGDTVNNGLNETLMRSINTTLTVLLPLFALFYLGGESIHNFALALLIGMASGAYSSIFIASPLLVLVEGWKRRKLATA